MELSSSTAEIREICEKRGEARAKLGHDAALELSRILADVEAFDNFADFAATFGDQITDRGSYHKCFHMKAGHLVIFRSGQPSQSWRKSRSHELAQNYPTNDYSN